MASATRPKSVGVRMRARSGTATKLAPSWKILAAERVAAPNAMRLSAKSSLLPGTGHVRAACHGAPMRSAPFLHVGRQRRALRRGVEGASPDVNHIVRTGGTTERAGAQAALARGAVRRLRHRQFRQRRLAGGGAEFPARRAAAA